MKKNKAIKWVGIILLAVLALTLISAVSFYFLELKPRIDVAASIGRAFEGFEDCNVLTLDLDDGQQILLDISAEQTLSGVVYGGEKAYDGLEFGFFEDGIWLNIPNVSEKYYLLPWTDDVGDMLEDSAVAGILNLSDGQKQEISDALIMLREEFLEEDVFPFTPTFLNRILGLECLKADILELYRQIDFENEGKVELNICGESLKCHKYTANVPAEYVKRLLNTDGAGNFLTALGDVLGETYIEAYTYDGKIKYINVETELLYMPGLDLSKALTEGLSDESITFTTAPLRAEIYFNTDGKMDIYAELYGDYMELSASFAMWADNADITWGYDSESELNIFEAGYLRLLLEVTKWEEALNRYFSRDGEITHHN